jgi:DNA-binding transcriptional LysR family regulator
VSANVGVTVLPRSVVERNGSRELLRVESFAPEPVWVETLMVRPSVSYVSATLRAFDDALNAAATPMASVQQRTLPQAIVSPG